MSGSWLGGYGMTTLIKGISFPLFVAFANWAGVSYPFLLAVFYLLSVGIFCFALYKLNHNKTMASAALFLLLYNPAGFSSKITQRLYRNGLMYPAVLLVFSCILLVYIYRKEEKYKQIFWLVLSGISFSFFYYIREDSIWLMPLFLVSLVVIAVWFWGFSGYSKKEKIKRTGCLMIPILIFAILSAGYSGKNYLAYGVWETNDRSGSNFAKLTGNMIKIKDESDAGLNYWISRDTLERIVDHCPSLSGDKEVYMEAYDERSGEGDDGNVRGDWSVWAIREAFNRLGYYESARKINDFCSVVNDELLRAVDNGVLEFDDAIHFTSQSRGIYAYEIADFVKETFKNIWDVATYKEAYALLEESTGDPEYVNFMESITGAGIIEESGSTLKLGGWIILKDDAQNTSIDLVDSEGNVISSVDRYQREDVYKTYPDYESALYSGFSMELDGAVDTETAYFRIYEGDELIDTVSVDTQEDEQVILCIDDNQIATDKKKE
jgi:hypothetical protein